MFAESDMKGSGYKGSLYGGQSSGLKQTMASYHHNEYTPGPGTGFKSSFNPASTQFSAGESGWKGEKENQQERDRRY